MYLIKVIVNQNNTGRGRGQGKMKEVGWMGADEDRRCIRKRDRAVTSEEGGGKSMWPQT